MAKKRDGGSNMGLIVTLIFFVLATCILGVTTWLGFSEQDKLNAEKKKADDALKGKQKDVDWYRAQAHAYRLYMGHAPKGLDAQDMKLLRDRLATNLKDLGAGQKDVEDVTSLLTTLHKAMPWDPTKEDSPRSTYESRLGDKDKQYAQLDRGAAQLKRDKDESDRQAKEARDHLEEERKNFRGALVALDKKVEVDRKTDRDTIDTLRKDLAAKGEEKETETKARVKMEETLAKEAKATKRMERQLTQATNDQREMKAALEDTRARLAAMYERIGVDPRAVEAESLTTQSLGVLKTWNRDWRIIELDRRGEMPYINLGSADSLSPQMTFSVHAATRDGKLNPTAKGTIEVVRVIGPHLAQARVTSVRDSKMDPILKGDRLFNPTWDPSRKKRVALVGVADLGTENAYTNDAFRRLLNRQSVILDASIDLRDEKEPRLVGAGVTANTEYLILGDGLDAVNHPQAKNKEYRDRYEKLVTQLKLQAKENSVPVISIQKYLDMIGYRAPKVIGNPEANR